MDDTRTHPRPAAGDADISTGEGPPTERESRWGPHHRWEFVVAIVLSLATVLSAWSGYESTRWGAKATRLNRSATNAMFRAATANSDGQRQQTTDTSLFTEWVRAALDGDTDRAGFVEARFRPGFIPAFEDWLGDTTLPTEHLPDASPFQTDGYSTPGFDEARSHFAEVDTLQQDADRASRTGQTYVLIAVLFASVLFFGGISTKVTDLRASRLLIVMAVLALIGAVIELLSQPVLVFFS